MPDLRERVRKIIDYTGTDQRLELVKEALQRALKETAMPETKGLEPIAWRVRNDKGYFYTTGSDWLARRWRSKDGRAVEPLYSADAIERLERERDEARATVTWLQHNSVLKNPVEPSIHDRATTAEASLSAAQAENKTLKEALDAIIDRYAARTTFGSIVAADEQNPQIAQAMAARSLIGGTDG